VSGAGPAPTPDERTGVIRVRAVVEYDGAAYAGWQIQPDQPTVQASLENALETALRTPVRVEGAGRTDAGVHALGQVAAFDVPDGTDLYRLRGSLNGITGRDIAIVSIEQAPDGFDPRRDAVGRTYRYMIVAGRPASPLLADRSWHVPGRLDLDVLRRLAAATIGTHDFAAFRASDCESPSTVRVVSESRWSEDDGVLTYEICANAFLKQMVRVVVGSMVDVALGRIDETVFLDLLEGGDRTLAGRTAPARGLILVSVEY